MPPEYLDPSITFLCGVLLGILVVCAVSVVGEMIYHTMEVKDREEANARKAQRHEKP